MHALDHIGKSLSGRVVTSVESHPNERSAWPQLFEEHRTGRVFVHSGGAVSVERLEYFAGVPFIARLFENLENYGSIPLFAERDH